MCSRLMLSTICKDGLWSHQKWLSQTIGNDKRVTDSAIYLRNRMALILADSFEN